MSDGSNVITLATSNPHSKKHGVCRICGEVGGLTWAHVPARSAFNDGSVEGLFQREWDWQVKNGRGSVGKATMRRPARKGWAIRSQCSRCNNKHVERWDRHYSCFVKRVAASMVVDPEGVLTVTPPDSPRDFMRAVVALILSIEPPSLGERFPDLRDFVLCEHQVVRLPWPVYAFHVPLSAKAGTIQPLVGRVDTYAPGFGMIGGEISRFPFGFVYGPQFGDAYRIFELSEIGHWAWYAATEPFIRLRSRVTAVDTVLRASEPRTGPEYGGAP